jgi:hypothetical protein
MLASHLQTCPSCRQALARARLLVELLQADPLPAVPQGFAERLVAQARLSGAIQSPARTSRPLRRWWTSVPTGQRVAAAALLILGLSAGMLMGWQTGQRKESQSQARSSAPEDSVTVFNLDYLGSTPEESLPQTYLTLVSAQGGNGK